ncbi:MAG TPA: hypothetical protein VLE72_00550 [Candidatus Saccharimonadales bacterium]|nr:hypothetical protein [Candidatus Saccharimonadales bacterium]
MHVFTGISTVFGCLVVVGLLAAILLHWTPLKPSMVILTAITAWVTLMWLVGSSADWWLFTHYALGWVVLSWLLLIVAFVITFIGHWLWLRPVFVLLLLIPLIFYGVSNFDIHHGHGTATADGYQPTSTTEAPKASTKPPTLPKGFVAVRGTTCTKGYASTGYWLTSGFVICTSGATLVLASPAGKCPQGYKPGATFPATSRKRCFYNGTRLSQAERNRVIRRSLMAFGFKPGQIKTGAAADLNGAPQERGIAAFTHQTIMVKPQLVAYVNGSSPESMATRQRLQQCLAPMPGEFQRALNGEGYTLVKFTVPVEIQGTTYYNQATHQVLTADGWRTVGANDGYWVFQTRNGTLVPCAIVRADCGNSRVTAIRPVPPNEASPPPSVEVPPKKNCAIVDPDPQTAPTCGSNMSGPDQQPVQEHHQAHVPGYNPGGLENIQAIQPVGSPNPAQPIAHSPAGNNSGSTTGGSAGADTTTGQVQGPAPDQSGGTHGTDQNSEGTGQNSSGSPTVCSGDPTASC